MEVYGKQKYEITWKHISFNYSRADWISGGIEVTGSNESDLLML